MGISLLFNKKQGAVIGELTLDATLQESYDYNNEVTAYPVEDGSIISDHIKLNPDEISITGFVTNTPASLFQRKNSEVNNNESSFFDYKNLQRSGSVNNVELAHDILLNISGRKIDGANTEPLLVTLVVGLRSFSNMAMTSLNIPRDSKMGETLHFTARFRKILKTNTETIKFPNTKAADKDKAQNPVSKGNQNTKDTTTEQKTKVSYLKRGFYKIVL
jgi:hypothetical protein